MLLNKSNQPLGVIEFILLLALLNSLTAFATDSLMPAQIIIGQDFGIDSRVSLQ